MAQQRCKDRIESEFDSTMKELRKSENPMELGLSFDRVEAGTFEGQRDPYYRWQLSWGGPSDEFRLYDNNDLEYWFLDWFDGACVLVTGADKDFIINLIEYLKGN